MKVNHTDLRRCVLEAARDVEAADAIVPFGFEIFDGRRFLNADIRRIYIYFSVGRSNSSSAADEYDFYDAFCEKAAKLAPNIVRNIGLLITPEGPTVLAPHRDVSCYIRRIDTERSLIAEYSRHIALAPLRLHDRSLPELGFFILKPSARRFVFQVATITDYINGARHLKQVLELLGPLIASEANRDPMTGMSPVQAASKTEIRALNEIVYPACKEAARLLKRDPEVQQFIDFNSGASEITLANSVELDSRSRRLQRGYLSFSDESGGT